jgi:hypothetical protein
MWKFRNLLTLPTSSVRGKRGQAKKEKKKM